MWISRKLYIEWNSKLEKSEFAVEVALAQIKALETRLQEQKDETGFWKNRSREERERAERAVDLGLQIRHNHPGIQKDPEEVFSRAQAAADDIFEEIPELVKAQRAHMEVHGPDSLLREELSGLYEPDDGSLLPEGTKR